MRGHHYAQRSHGEMFVDMLTGRFMELGLWILDEPESALSFTASLTLLQLIRERQPSPGPAYSCRLGWS